MSCMAVSIHVRWGPFIMIIFNYTKPDWTDGWTLQEGNKMLGSTY